MRIKPLNKKHITDHTITRFFNKVKKIGSCWEWQAGIDDWGYGRFSIDGKTISSHRASYIIFVGRIPKGFHIMHRCNNTKCVNPSHLKAATALENMRHRMLGHKFWRK